MSTPIDQTAFTNVLFAVLNEMVRKPDGIVLDKNTSLLDTIAELDAAAVSKSAVAGGSTISAHIRHATFYLQVMEEYAKDAWGDEPPDWSAAWKQKEVTAEEWEALKDDFIMTFERVMALYHSFDDWNDEKKLGSALGNLAHISFHLGAIRQLVIAVTK